MKFDHITVADGLSQGSVFSILEDRYGFMWFGTRTGGLNRYDGYSFTTYKYSENNPHSISNNEILSLYEDSKGIIWAGTRNGGLNRFDNETESFYRYRNDFFKSDSCTD